MNRDTHAESAKGTLPYKRGQRVHERVTGKVQKVACTQLCAQASPMLGRLQHNFERSSSSDHKAARSTRSTHSHLCRSLSVTDKSQAGSPPCQGDCTRCTVGPPAVTLVEAPAATPTDGPKAGCTGLAPPSPLVEADADPSPGASFTAACTGAPEWPSLLADSPATVGLLVVCKATSMRH